MISKTKLVELLGSSLKPIDYSASLIPTGRFMTPPPHAKHPNSEKGFKIYFGEWPAARHLFHLVYYERNYSVPAMEHWLGEPHPKFDLMFPEPEEEEASWSSVAPEDLDEVKLIQQLRSARSEQILIAEAVPEIDYLVERLSTSLGKLTFVSVVMKTIQHTFEHGNELLKNALYWDGALEWLDRQG